MSWLSDLLDRIFRRRVPPAPLPPTPTPTPGDLPARLLAAFNAERQRRRLPPFLPDHRLTAAASGHADDMARHGRLSHTGSDGSEFYERIARAGLSGVAMGEVIAQGQTTVEQVVASWMASPGHRAQILGDYTHAGADGRGVWWCACFAVE
jgi:uncharacterized protein YkwD